MTTHDSSVSTSSPDESKKQRKKQAKREARAMLKVEQARTAVQKAEKKVAKAQNQLEASRTSLRNLEERLDAMHHAAHEQENSAPDIGFDQQQGQPEPEVLESVRSTGEQAHEPALAAYQSEIPTPNPTAEQPGVEETAEVAGEPFSLSEDDETSTREADKGVEEPFSLSEDDETSTQTSKRSRRPRNQQETTSNPEN